MTTKQYTLDWSGFKQYTADEFSRVYPPDSEPGRLVYEIIHGLPVSHRYSVVGFLDGRAKEDKKFSQDTIKSNLRGAWLYLYKRVYGHPYQNPKEGAA